MNAIKSGSADGTTLVFTDGMDNWTPLRDVAKLQGPPAGERAAADAGGRRPALRPRAHEIDYKIVGEDLQFVEVELDPGESVVAEAGALMYMTQGIQMETIFGDGSGQRRRGPHGRAARSGQAHPDRREPVHDGLHGPGRPQGARSPSPLPIPAGSCRWTSSKLGGELICQKDSFLCAAKGVSIGIAFQKKIGVGLFGGEGFIMQRLQGDGWPSCTPAECCTELQLGAGRDAARRHRAAWWPCSPR